MADERKEDITIRLALAALDTEDVDPAELEALLREAIVEIETLRVQVSAAVVKLGDVEPEGNA
jgi:hypothetical protein